MRPRGPSGLLPHAVAVDQQHSTPAGSACIHTIACTKGTELSRDPCVRQDMILHESNNAIFPVEAAPRPALERTSLYRYRIAYTCQHSTCEVHLGCDRVLRTVHRTQGYWNSVGPRVFC